VAGLYQATRPGYPADLAGFVAATAAIGAGSAVPEVGCGTMARVLGASPGA